MVEYRGIFLRAPTPHDLIPTGAKLMIDILRISDRHTIAI
jgi:hypothetical protein